MLTRRLWKDITLKTNFYHYDLSNYNVIDFDDKSTPWHRRTYDLEDVDKEGVEIQLSGHLLQDLAFNVGYSYQDWDYDGKYPEMGDRLSDKAKHRVKGGLRYKILPSTLCLLDYAYQSDQIAYNHREEPPGSENWIEYTNRMDSHQVFDVAVEHTLIRDKGFLKDLKLKVYSNNVLDEEYEQARGFPMTDRTFGVALSCSL